MVRVGDSGARWNWQAFWNKSCGLWGKGGRDGRLTGPWGGTLHFLRSSCEFLLSLPQETGGPRRKRDSLMPSWPCNHWTCCVLSLSMPQGPGRYSCSRKDPRLRGLGLKGLLLSPLTPFLVLFVRTQQLPRNPSVSLPPSFPTPVLPPLPAGFCVLSPSGPLSTKEVCGMVSETLPEGPAMCWTWDTDWPTWPSLFPGPCHPSSV